MTTITKPSCYFACLASYNAGVLHGAWVDMTQNCGDVYDEVQMILRTSLEEGAEEWAIHDYEGFEGYKVEEWSDIEELCEIAELIESGIDGQLVVAIKDYLGSGTTLSDAKEFIENNHRGVYDDLEDYAYQFCQECCDEVPKHLEYYIDWAAMGRDWDMSGDIFTITLDDGMHVFTNM